MNEKQAVALITTYIAYKLY